MYMHTYVHMYMHTYVYMYMHTYVHMYKHTYVHTVSGTLQELMFSGHMYLQLFVGFSQSKGLRDSFLLRQCPILM